VILVVGHDTAWNSVGVYGGILAGGGLCCGSLVAALVLVVLGLLRK
jgi:hypothetical protein